MSAAPGPGDRGSATIAVMLFGALAVLAALSVAGQFVTEYRAVEDSLAQTRAYWAAMGQAAYVLSRTMQSGPCAGGCGNGNNNKQGNFAVNPDAYQSTAQSYLNEISGKNGLSQSWMYPDVASAYQFTVNSTVCNDPLAAAGQVGEMLLVLSVAASTNCPPAPPPSGTAPAPSPCPKPAALPPNAPQALRSVPLIRPVEVRYCLTAGSAVTQCGAGPNVSTLGYNLVTSIHRPAC